MRDFDIVETHDGVWFYAIGAPVNRDGCYGSAKYVRCDATEASTYIFGSPARRLWSKRIDGTHDEPGMRERYPRLRDGRYFIAADRICRTYSSAEAASTLLSGDSKLPRAATAQRLLRLLLDLGTERTALRVIGSYLLGNATGDSDIDIVVDGPVSVRAVWNGLHTAAGYPLRFRTAEEWARYELYGGRVGLSPAEYAAHNARKVDRGYFDGLEFSIIGVSPTPISIGEDAELIGEVTISGTVLCHRDGGFLPGRWRVSVDSPVAGHDEAWLINQDREFTYQVFEDERIHATGEAYVTGKDARILVGPAQRPHAFIQSDSPEQRRFL